MSKGSRRRPLQIPRPLYDLKWELAMKKITFEEYEKRLKKLASDGIIDSKIFP